MNVAAYEALHSHFDVHYAGPINPPFFAGQKLSSKLRRMAGIPGAFSLFSDRRLRLIADQVRECCRTDAVMDFFHGFTPWLLSRPERPYMAFSDCTFRDYIDIFHPRGRFDSHDLSRIETAEADWLRNASMVLFSSTWAAKRAPRQYGLDPSRIETLKSAGEIDLPSRDEFAGGQSFAFVSTNFLGKGGEVVLAAFREVRERHRAASLHVVGDVPAHLEAEPGVTAVGFLHKEIPEESARLRAILAGARALVHPTHSDVSPLIIIEAAYFGCPAISSRSFAIPELVDDGRSGLLLDDPSDAGSLARAMSWTIDQEDEYRAMRKRAWVKSRSEYSRSRSSASLQEFVNRVIGATSA